MKGVLERSLAQGISTETAALIADVTLICLVLDVLRIIAELNAEAMKTAHIARYVIKVAAAAGQKGFVETVLYSILTMITGVKNVNYQTASIILTAIIPLNVLEVKPG
jgi:hypothetical protein